MLKWIGLILLIIIAIPVFAWLCGAVVYFLLAVAFPEYVSFDWYLWRFLALGFLFGGLKSFYSNKDKE